MVRVLKALSWALGFFSLMLLGLALRRTPSSPTQQAEMALHVETSSRSFGEAPVGTESVVGFSLSNRGQRGVTILGSDAVCYQAACLKAEGLPLTVPPGEVRLIEIKVLCTSPGEFSRPLTLFTDSAAQREITLSVEGRVVERATCQ